MKTRLEFILILLMVLTLSGLSGFIFGVKSSEYDNIQKTQKFIENMKKNDPNLYKYWTKIIHYSSKYGISPYWVASVICSETGFNPNSISPVGAVGLAQIMPDTAKGIAKEIGIKKYSLKNADIQVMFCCHYLKNCLKRFGGNITLATASYNCGPGNAKIYHTIPQTKTYVRRVMSKYKHYKKEYCSIN